MANPKSNTLFHFTKDIESLQGILENGFYPRFCLENFNWLDSSSDKVAFPITCFCDIPLGRVFEHVRFYGSYGLGLKRTWGLANGLNPIQYHSDTSHYAEHFNAAWKKMWEDFDKDDDREDIRFLSLLGIAAFHKPMNGENLVDGKLKKKEFYQECEWRFVANHPKYKFLFVNEFANETKLKKANQIIADSLALKFKPKDVKYIFIKEDADIHGLVEYINKTFIGYPSDDRNVLISRITSLESIELDL